MCIRNAHAKLMLCAREKQPRSLTIHKTITTMIAATIATTTTVPSAAMKAISKTPETLKLAFVDLGPLDAHWNFFYITFTIFN